MRGLLVDCKVAARLYLRTPVSSLIAVVVAWLRRGFLSSQVAPGVVAAAVVVGLTGLTLLASLGPARRARRTEPATLLREE